MKKIIIFTLPIFLALSLLLGMRLKARSNQLQILLPLYIYPNWYEPKSYPWSEVAKAAKKVPITAIINPNNGPDGKPPNQDYQRGIRDLKVAGIRILGYIPTNYGKRPIAEVKNDVDIYVRYFDVTGIFLDESSSDRSQVSYYRDIYHYIKSAGKMNQVIINPGTVVDEQYLSQPVADNVVIFEDQAKAWTKYVPPNYIGKYQPKYFSMLVHTVNRSQTMKEYLDMAKKRNFGYVYITNDSTETGDRNPWNSLPSYWQEQVNYIHQLNQQPN